MKRAAAMLAGFGVLVFAQLASGGSEQAAAWEVGVGEQGKPPAGTPKQAFLNQFLPGQLTINAGDKVTFSSFGFHTVTYLAGRAIPPDVFPEKGAVYEGINDAAGQPFYFEGKQKFVYNGPKFGPAGPKTIKRGTYASAGVIVPQNPKKPVTATYTFPQAGTFKLICLIHPPDMKMTVVVKPKGATVPTAEEVVARAQEETDASWAQAKALVAQKPPASTVYMGVDGSKAKGGRITVLDFVPNLTTVKAGTRVTFRMKSPTEFHNVGFGPVKYLNKFMKQTDLFPFGPKDPNQVTPPFLYGTDPPGTPHDGTNHGNGFYATGLADGIRGGLPNSYRITFTKPGKYHFICMLHGPDMAADIRVTK